jgi:chromosome segregation ATPase
MSSSSASHHEASVTTTSHKQRKVEEDSTDTDNAVYHQYNDNLKVYLDHKKKLDDIHKKFNQERNTPPAHSSSRKFAHNGEQNHSPRNIDTPATPELHAMKVESPYPLPFLTPSPNMLGGNNRQQQQYYQEQRRETMSQIDDDTVDIRFVLTNFLFIYLLHNNNSHIEDLSLADLSVGLESVRNTLAAKELKLRAENDSPIDDRSDSPTSNHTEDHSKYTSQNFTVNQISSEEKLRNEVIKLRREVDVLTLDKAAMSGKNETLQRENNKLRDDYERERKLTRSIKHHTSENYEVFSDQIVDIQYGKVSKTFQKTEEQFKEQTTLLKSKIALQSKEIEELYNKIQDIQKDKLAAQKGYLQRDQEKEDRIHQLTQLCNELRKENLQWRSKSDDVHKQFAEKNDMLRQKVQGYEDKIAQLDAQCKILNQKLTNSSSSEQTEKSIRNQLEQQIYFREQSYKQEINRLQQEVTISNEDLQNLKNEHTRKLEYTKKQLSEQQIQIQIDLETVSEKLQKQLKETEKLETERGLLYHQCNEHKQQHLDDLKHIEILNKEIQEVMKREQENNNIARKLTAEEQNKFREYMDSYDLKMSNIQRQLLALERERDSLKEQNKTLLAEGMNLKERYKMSLKELANQSDVLRKDIANYKLHNEQLANDNNEMSQQLEKFVNMEQSTTEKLKTQMHDQYTLYEIEIQKLESDRQELIRQREQDEKQFSHQMKLIQRQLQGKDSDLEQLAQRIAKQDDILKQKNDELRRYHDQLYSKQEQVSTLESKLASYSRKLADLENTKHYDDSSRSRELQSRVRELQQLLELESGNSKTLADKFEKLKEENVKLKKRIQEQKESIAHSSVETESLRNKAKNQAQTITSLEQDVQNVRSENERLISEKVSLETSAVLDTVDNSEHVERQWKEHLNVIEEDHVDAMNKQEGRYEDLLEEQKRDYDTLASKYERGLQEYEKLRNDSEVLKSDYEQHINHITSLFQEKSDSDKKLVEDNTELRLHLESLQEDFEKYKKRVQQRDIEDDNNYRLLREEYERQLNKLKEQFKTDTRNIKNREWTRAKREIQKRYHDQLQEWLRNTQVSTQEISQQMKNTLSNHIVPMVHQLQEENDQLSEELFKLQEELDHIQRNDVNRQWDYERSYVSNYPVEDTAKLNETINILKTELSQLRSTRSTNDSIVESLEKQNSTLKQQLRRAESRVPQLEQENQRLRDVHEQQRILQKSVQEQISSIEHAIQDQEATNASELRKSQNQSAFLKDQVRALESRCESLDHEVMDLQNHARSDKKTISNLKTRLELAVEENDSLKKSKLSFRS